MSKRILTVTIDGQAFTRESDRAYTHAVVIVCTQAERDAKLAVIQARVDAAHADVAEATERLECAGEATAFAEATARLAYLEESVTEPLRGMTSEGRAPLLNKTTGEIVMHTTLRYLSESYIDAIEDAMPIDKLAQTRRRSSARDIACSHCRSARAAVLATAHGKLEDARKRLAREEAAHANAAAHYVVGHITCENWSQSAKGAAKLADDVRKYRPDADIRITTDITVHQPKQRARRAS